MLMRVRASFLKNKTGQALFSSVFLLSFSVTVCYPISGNLRKLTLGLAAALPTLLIECFGVSSHGHMGDNIKA